MRDSQGWFGYGGQFVNHPIAAIFQMWLNIQDSDWVPRTYLELEALPCILIFTGMDPQGESLPR